MTTETSDFDDEIALILDEIRKDLTTHQPQPRKAYTGLLATLAAVSQYESRMTGEHPEQVRRLLRSSCEFARLLSECPLLWLRAVDDPHQYWSQRVPR